MIKIQISIISLVVLGSISLFLRGIDYLYYLDTTRVLYAFRLLSPFNENAEGLTNYYKPLDSIFAILPFIWIWLDIFIAIQCMVWWKGFWVLPLVFLIGARLRALQEVAHVAVHKGLCPSKRWQRSLGSFWHSNLATIDKY